MAPKHNPLKLNPLQLKTLTLMQELARHAQSEGPEGGEVKLTSLPYPHGDHFHVGDAVVLARDASGLRNESVWRALERKGLVRLELPDAIAVTEAGRAYETGLDDEILHRAQGHGH